MSKKTNDQRAEHTSKPEGPSPIEEVALDSVVGAGSGRQQNPMGNRNVNQVSTQAGTLTIRDN